MALSKSFKVNSGSNSSSDSTSIYVISFVPVLPDEQEVKHRNNFEIIFRRYFLLENQTFNNNDKLLIFYKVQKFLSVTYPFEM